VSANLSYRFIQMYPNGFGVQLGDDGGFTLAPEMPNAKEHAEFIASAPAVIKQKDALIAELVEALRYAIKEADANALLASTSSGEGEDLYLLLTANLDSPKGVFAKAKADQK